MPVDHLAGTTEWKILYAPQRPFIRQLKLPKPQRWKQRKNTRFTSFLSGNSRGKQSVFSWLHNYVFCFLLHLLLWSILSVSWPFAYVFHHRLRHPTRSGFWRATRREQLITSLTMLSIVSFHNQRLTVFWIVWTAHYHCTNLTRLSMRLIIH